MNGTVSEQGVASLATHGDRTRAAILSAGLAIMRDDPTKLTVRAIGRAIGLTHQTVLYHFNSAEALRTSLAEHAVSIGDGVVIPYLIAVRHPACDGMADDVRAGYLAGC